ncbi:DUF6476 family protein [Sulfitobacter sp. HNIBRBA3233]|uniref:DUF6476 family protein n=1 Tax=Sulfitobacter marinivivus TaxID=3158558 RepID=UPI0032DE8938
MDELPEPGNLRFLRRMVTVLTLVMIGGVVVVIGLLVTRLGTHTPPLPAEITLPDGARATALTQGQDWYAVVTDRNQILIFDRMTGALRQTVDVK